MNIFVVLALGLHVNSTPVNVRTVGLIAAAALTTSVGAEILLSTGSLEPQENQKVLTLEKMLKTGEEIEYGQRKLNEDQISRLPTYVLVARINEIRVQVLQVPADGTVCDEIHRLVIEGTSIDRELKSRSGRPKYN
jgi:hypothetical protein